MDGKPMGNHKDIAKHYLSDNAPNELEKYSAFLQLYEESTAPLRVDGGHVIQIDESLLENHERLGEVVTDLRKNPAWTRAQFAKAIWPQSSGSDREKRNEHRAIAAVVQVGFMLNCNLRDQHSKGHRIGDWTPPRWEGKEPFRDFVERAIPRQKLASSEPLQHKGLLKIWKLAKRCGMGIDATNNISEHLLYDPHTNRLRVFHHTSWLHAQLERLGGAQDDHDLNQCLKLGTLPRQLILETLDSFYQILFPLTTDKKGKSKDLLKKLIKDKRFDANANSQNYSLHLPDKFEYYYWGNRLEILLAIAKKPPPSNQFMSWMERHKNERNILWVAIVGLFLSAFFGLLSCLIGVGQLYVAVIALKQNPP